MYDYYWYSYLLIVFKTIKLLKKTNKSNRILELWIKSYKFAFKPKTI